MTNLEPRHPENLRLSRTLMGNDKSKIKGLGEETLAFTSSSSEESWIRKAALKEELMSWPQANLEALPNKTHVSTRTKSNQLNYFRS